MLASNSSSVNASCEVQDGFLAHTLPITYGVICALGLLCNTFTIFVFFLRQHSDTSMAVYMRHLAIADFLLVLCLPLRIHYHHREGPYYLCKAVGVFFYINMYASIMFLSLISLDRYLKVIKPIWVFRIQKVRWSRMASYAIWAALFGVMSLFFLGKEREHPCNRICFHFHDKGVLGGSINLVAVGVFFASFLVFLCFYGKITFRLSAMSLGNGDPKAQGRKKRMVLKTFLVPAIFTLCFLPYHVVRVPYVLAQMDVITEVDKKQLLHILNEFTLLLSALNSCLDPLIYYFLSSTYRKTILCAIQGKFKSMYALNRRRISINRSLTEI
ncbi:G protein-coupled receptor 34 like [Chanos chanos]|uniref:Probable G-protein coupled receptor 34 n=1 Tax=Chanos chanos TaxID=29144 RepID=A0A6J2WY75_CHACN|nr:probable G-protein coupled receptor 34 [Chanos chanos]